MSGNCGFATGIMPDYFCLSVSGISDGAAGCDSLNGNWLLAQQGSGSCQYKSVNTFTAGFLNLEWTMEFKDTEIEADISIVNGGAVSVYTKPGGQFTGDATHTMNLVSNTLPCNGITGSSVTATPSATASCAGDPHFVGFEGDRFDFHGVPDKTYNLLSDYNVSVNALFGDYPSVPGTTYLQEMGIMVGTYEAGFSRIRFDAKTGRIYMNDRMLKKKKEDFPTGLIGPGGSIEITMDRSWQSMLDGLPAEGIFQNGIIVHTGAFRLLIPRFISEQSGISHLSLFATYTGFPVSPHGIVGQTADFDGKPRIGTGPNGEGAIEGLPEDYEVKDLFSPDFTFSRFAIVREQTMVA